MGLSHSEIAMQITIAALQSIAPSGAESGISKADEVASFYETIFKKVVEMHKQARTLLDT